MRREILWVQLVLLMGCGGFSEGRYRTTFAKVRNIKPAATAVAPVCQPSSPEVKCAVMFPERDISDAIGQARAVKGADPAGAVDPRDRVYYKLLEDGSAVADFARHGPASLYPGVPFLFDLASLDPNERISKAVLRLHVLATDSGTTNWIVTRLGKGLGGTELASAGGGGKAALPLLKVADSDFNDNPNQVFEGLKYLAFKSEAFGGKRYVDHLDEGGLLGQKTEEARPESDGVSFDVTAAVTAAQDAHAVKVILFLSPRVGAADEKSIPCLFVATRAAAESMRPTLTVEYSASAPAPEPPPAAAPPAKTKKKKGKK